MASNRIVFVEITQETSRRMAVMGFVCACMIVGIHCTPHPDCGTWQWWVANILGADGLCRVAVPWFFIASGFFLAGRVGEPSWYSNAVKKRVRTLLVPFVIWAIVGLVLNWLMFYGSQKAGYVCHVPNMMANGLMSALMGALGFDLDRINIGPIWYLRMLFILVLFSPILCRVTLKIGIMFPALLLLGYGIYDSTLHFSNFWEYLISVRGIAYFSIGMVLRFGNIRMKHRVRGLYFGGLAVVAFMLLSVNAIARFYGIPVLEYLCDFLMVPPLLICIWRGLSAARLPDWCTGNSFALYVMHGTFLSLSIVFVVASGVRSYMGTSLSLAALRMAFAIAGSLCLSQVVKRFCPGVARVLFGGR